MNKAVGAGHPGRPLLAPRPLPEPAEVLEGVGETWVTRPGADHGCVD